MSMITKNLLIKNSILNIICQFAPLMVTIFTIPYIVAHLGMARYGIYTIVMTLVNYFGIFDFGFGTATAKFIADSLGRNDHLSVIKMYWTSVFFIICMSAIGICIFYFSVPVLVTRFFVIEPDLLPEIIAVSLIASPTIVSLLVKSVFIGTVQAYQRFDLTNMISVPNAIFSAIIPVLVLSRGGNLREIAFWMMIVELVFTLIWYVVSSSVISERKFRGFLDMPSFLKVGVFSFWLVVQRIMNLIHYNVHTIIIGMSISVSMVGYYSIPYTLANKIGIIGSGIAPVIFTAASHFDASSQEKEKRLFRISLKYVMLMYGLICLVLIVFAKEILVLWLGKDFIKSVFVTQILAVSMFLAGVSWIFSIFAQVNNPRFCSITSILITPCYLLLLWILTKRFSFNGCGYAWFLYCLATTFIYIGYFIKKKFITSLFKINVRFLAGLFWLMGIILLNIFIKNIEGLNVFIVGSNIVLFMAGYSLIAWIYFVDLEQKSDIIDKIKSFLISYR